MTEPGFVRIADYGDADEARRMGATLLESGIVAAVDEQGGLHELSVLEADVQRACDILDVPAPESEPILARADDEGPPKPVRATIPRERIPVVVAGYVVVVVILTIGAFVAAVYLFGGDFGGRTEVPEVPEFQTTPGLVRLHVGDDL